MASRQKLDGRTTHAPQGLLSFTSEGKKNLSDQDWGVLQDDLYQGITAALSARNDLEANLKDWNDLYEMSVEQTNWPWQNASNIFIPLIPSQVDTAVAYITGKVFVPRFYIVTANTPEASPFAHQVERYYNAELVRQRGQRTWYDEYCTWLHLAFRDGTAVMEVLWRKTVTKRKIATFAPSKDDNGVPVIDQSTGRAKSDRIVREQEIVEYNDVELKPVLLRDFVIIPDEAESIDAAVAVCRALWLYEDDLNKMVKEGTLREDRVERALSYTPNGQNEFSSDRQGDYDRTAGGQIAVGNAQGSQMSRFFRNRGPIKVWRIHSRQYDMNGDGIPEENIFFLHEQSQTMLGWTEYEYLAPGRPFFAFCPYERPARFYGYSLCERLAPIQAEVNAGWNARNNLIDLMLQPPLLYGAGEELDDRKQQWGPGVRWPVSDPKAVQFMEFPQVPLASFEQEQLLNSYVDKLTGLSNPMQGAQTTGRRSAAEIKQLTASTTTRNDLVAMRLRVVCRAIFNFIHSLKLQYMDNDAEYTENGQKFTIPREVLSLDYQNDVAGSADPLDASARRQENLALFELLMKVPFVGQDQVKTFNCVRMLLEAFNRADVVSLIGTDQEAMQRQQAQEKQQQEQQQMQKVMLMMKAKKELGGPHGSGGGSAPPAQQGNVPPMANRPM